MDKYTEGPGIIIVKNETSVSGTEVTFTIAVDEQYMTELLASKFNLTIEPRA